MFPSAPVRAIIDAALHATAAPTEVTVATLVGEQRHVHFAAYGQASDHISDAVESVLIWITDVTARIQAEQLAEGKARQVQAQADVPGQPTVTRRVSTSRQQQAWATERQQWQAERTQLMAQLEQMSGINSTLFGVFIKWHPMTYQPAVA